MSRVTKPRRKKEIEPPERGELLRSVPMFAKLDDEELAQLSQLGRWSRISSGESLFQEGERGMVMFVVAQGRFSIHKSSIEGPKFIAERGRGEVLGEMALFDGRRRSASAVCQTDGLLLAIGREELMGCIGKNPSVAMGLIANLIDRLREADTRATLAASLDTLGRLADFLLDRGRLVDERQILRPRPTDHEISQKIGCSRETVSRKIAELESKGLVVRRKGEIEIVDEDGLERLTGG